MCIYFVISILVLEFEMSKYWTTVQRHQDVHFSAMLNTSNFSIIIWWTIHTKNNHEDIEMYYVDQTLLVWMLVMLYLIVWKATSQNRIPVVFKVRLLIWLSMTGEGLYLESYQSINLGNGGREFLYSKYKSEWDVWGRKIRLYSVIKSQRGIFEQILKDMRE